MLQVVQNNSFRCSMLHYLVNLSRPCVRVDPTTASKAIVESLERAGWAKHQVSRPGLAYWVCNPGGIWLTTLAAFGGPCPPFMAPLARKGGRKMTHQRIHVWAIICRYSSRPRACLCFCLARGMHVVCAPYALSFIPAGGISNHLHIVPVPAFLSTGVRPEGRPLIGGN